MEGLKFFKKNVLNLFTTKTYHYISFNENYNFGNIFNQNSYEKISNTFVPQENGCPQAT
jgi:hypothetical protein